MRSVKKKILKKNNKQQLFVSGYVNIQHSGIVALAYLCIGEHDVLDEGQAAGFAVLDTDVVHLVSADLPVLFP